MTTTAVVSALHVLLAGIVAKGLGAIAVIFLLGLIFGVVLTVMATSRIRRIRNR